ncbi:DUF6245 family protein [Nonomuraea jabiensis]|uniref:DUF6245 family protein n=1 Tax=Nonomuraea jabiensis TaxID=882448 RepID=UPI003D741E30
MSSRSSTPYTGEGNQATHDAEVERLGERRYLVRLVGALLGAAQIEAILAEIHAKGVDLAEVHDQ